jgi:hypothetical protein
MDNRSPYAPPASKLTVPGPAVGGSTRALLAAVAAVQLVLWLIAAPGLLQQVRFGEIAPIGLLAALASMPPLIVAAALALKGRSSCHWWYLMSALASGFAALTVQQPVATVGLLVGLASAVIFWVVPRFRSAAA